MVDHLFGLLKVKVVRGLNLAIRDVRTSDPYVVLRLGKHKVKTHVKKRTTNPEWNEELTLSVENPNAPLKIEVFDKDILSRDDAMGHAEVDIRPLIQAVTRDLSNEPSDAIIETILPSHQNCFAEESKIYWSDGKVTQDMAVRLKDVECGEIEIKVTWGTFSGGRSS
ncbi:hypothetical protein LUZ60_012696 [Juncus effusus]|nr:hypothetical protein LUZ60_012696 [Juncus effusus]